MFSQMNPVHTLTPYYPQIYFNIILLFISRSPKRIPLLDFWTNLPFPCISQTFHVPQLNPLLLYMVTHIAGEYKTIHSPLCNHLPPITYILLGINILLST